MKVCVVERFGEPAVAYTDRAMAEIKSELAHGSRIYEIEMDPDCTYLLAGLRPFAVAFKAQKIIAQQQWDYVEGVTRHEPDNETIVSVIAKDAVDATRRAIKIYKSLKPEEALRAALKENAAE